MDSFNFNYDLNEYKIFYVVAKCGSFSNAGEVLNVTQPSISYSIKKLEKQLNTKLFNRTKGGVDLTPEGKYIFTFVEYALNNLYLCEEKMSKKTEVKETLNIGIHSHFCVCFFAKVVKEFENFFPNVTINIFNDTSSKLKELFNDGKIDLLVLHYPLFSDLDDQTIFQEKLASLESCFFANKKIYDLSVESKQKVLNGGDIPLILPLNGFSTSESLIKVFKERNLNVKSNIYVYSTEAMISLVKEGVGIGWALKDSIKNSSNELYEVELDFKLPATNIGYAYRKSRFSPAISELISIMKKVVK